MITNLYAIRDRAAEETGPLFHAKNNVIAMRQFEQITKNEPYSADMDLLLIGSFDHDTTRLVVLSEPEKVIITMNSEVVNEA